MGIKYNNLSIESILKMNISGWEFVINDGKIKDIVLKQDEEKK